MYPPEDDPQEVTVWAHLTEHVPDYMANHFRFGYIGDLEDKADTEVSNGKLFIRYPYKEYGVYISMRDSMNERMEFYTSNHNEIGRPFTSTLKTLFSAVVLQYDEW